MTRQYLGIALALVVAGCAPSITARILTPTANGMTCPDAGICIDNMARLPQARALRAEAAGFVQGKFGAFQNQPRVMFCSTNACSVRFGLDGPRGLNFGISGIVISHRGWDKYNVRHEMIHHRQNEVFGVVQASNILPKWFIEGAAYSLSGDPRRPLPRAEIEAWRAQFEAYQAAGGNWRSPPG